MNRPESLLGLKSASDSTSVSDSAPAVLEIQNDSETIAVESLSKMDQSELGDNSMSNVRNAAPIRATPANLTGRSASVSDVLSNANRFGQSSSVPTSPTISSRRFSDWRANSTTNEDDDDDEPSSTSTTTTCHTNAQSQQRQTSRRTFLTAHRSLTPGPELSADSKRRLSQAAPTTSSSADAALRSSNRTRQSSGHVTRVSTGRGRISMIRREAQPHFNVEREAIGERMLKVGVVVQKGFDGLCFDDIEKSERKRTKSLTEPISVMTSCFSPTLPCSPSPTRMTDYTKQCYSPSTQRVVRNNLHYSPSPSPTPSPTRVRSMLRSLSPIAQRLPPGFVPVVGSKRKFSDTAGGGNGSSAIDHAMIGPYPTATNTPTPPPPPHAMTSSGSGTASQPQSPVPPLLFGHPSSASPHPFGPPAAKRLAGNQSPLVDRPPLSLTPTTTATMHSTAPDSGGLLDSTASSTSSFIRDESIIRLKHSLSTSSSFGSDTNGSESNGSFDCSVPLTVTLPAVTRANAFLPVRPDSTEAMPGTPNSVCSVSSLPITWPSSVPCTTAAAASPASSHGAASVGVGSPLHHSVVDAPTTTIDKPQTLPTIQHPCRTREGVLSSEDNMDHSTSDVDIEMDSSRETADAN